MSKNNPKPVRIGSSRTKNVPKVAFLAYWTSLKGPSGQNITFYEGNDVVRPKMSQMWPFWPNENHYKAH